jgi:hypothetical protein
VQADTEAKLKNEREQNKDDITHLEMLEKHFEERQAAYEASCTWLTARELHSLIVILARQQGRNCGAQGLQRAREGRDQPH